MNRVYSRRHREKRLKEDSGKQRLNLFSFVFVFKIVVLLSDCSTHVHIFRNSHLRIAWHAILVHVATLMS